MSWLLVSAAFLAGGGCLVLAARQGTPLTGAMVIGAAVAWGLIGALWLAGII